jgi:glycosyltransferase involved in cell wall biosynthesis
MPDRPLRVFVSVPAYWPALSFGGPIWIAKELADGLGAAGHQVEVVTTTLRDVDHGLSVRSRVAEVGGARVHYLATPLRYRWMGITPSAPLSFARLGRPDVAHIFGCRDPLGIAVAAWCRLRRIPYALEPLGMLRPRGRKVRLKHLLDPVITTPVARGAGLIVAASELEREDLAGLGFDRERIAVRPYPFPPPHPGRQGELRSRLGLTDEPLVLYVGRIAAGKGIEVLLEAVRGLPDAHVALVGPRDHADVAARVDAIAAEDRRVHVVPPTQTRPLDLYGDADVFVLPAESERENFGLVVAEAAAAGVPEVVSDRAGIAKLVEGRSALVVPPEAVAIREAVGRLLGDAELRERLGRGGLELAAELDRDTVVGLQELLYRRIVRQ